MRKKPIVALIYDFDYESTEDMLAKIRALSDIANERGQTLAQMALAWVLRDGITTSALIGASKP